jgi:hypothetical protein
LLSGITDWLDNIITAIKNVPVTLGEKLSGFFSTLGDKVSSLGTSIGSFFTDLWKNLGDSLTSGWEIVSGIPDACLEGLKGLFIPTEEDITSIVDDIKETYSGLLIDYDLKALWSSSKSIEDVKVTMYGSTVTVVDTSIFKKVIKEIRPYIRGFLALLLVLFNINQFLALIGQSPISLGGKVGEPYYDSGAERIEKK